MKKEGSITIYFCFILVSVLLVVSIATESARVGIAQAECKTFTTMAGESVLAGYARQVFEDYGILLVWEKNSVEEEIEKSLQANINMADLEESGTNFLKTDVAEVEALEKNYITDNGGENFVRQVIRYMKYGGFLEEVEALVQAQKNEEGSSSKDGTKISPDMVAKESQEVIDLATGLRKELKRFKDISELQEQFEETKKIFRRVRKKRQQGKKIASTVLNQLIEHINDLEFTIKNKKDHTSGLLFSMEEYISKRDDFVKKMNLEDTKKDFVDENLDLVKNVKDKLEKMKELSVSIDSDLTPEMIEELSDDFKEIQKVLKLIEKIHLEETGKSEREESLYKKAKRFLKDGALSFVIEDVSKVSEKTIPDSDLPSKEIDTKSKSAKKIEIKAMLAVYAGLQFGNYTKTKEDTCLKYEVEYLIGGEDNDKDNLLNTAGKLLLTRNVVCLAYLLTDRQKMSEVEGIAVAVSTAFGLPFLEPIVKGVLVEAWSLAEAASDVKMLLDSKKVPLLKTGDNWNTDLESLSGEEEEQKNGLTYLQYCELLILAQSGQKTVNRIMDLIQVNIQKRYQSAFSMKNCIAGVHIRTSFVIHPLFLAKPFQSKLISGKKSGYRYQCEYQNEY